MCHLQRAGYCAKGFTLFFTSSLKFSLLPSFCREANRGLKKLSNLLRITQMVSSRARIQTKAAYRRQKECVCVCVCVCTRVCEHRHIHAHKSESKLPKGRPLFCFLL